MFYQFFMDGYLSMKTEELIERISNGEDSYTQFKQQSIGAKDLAKEFVAFSNAEGGIVIFGITDSGDIIGLDSDELEKIGQLVGNVANQNVKPPIHPLTKNLTLLGKKITIVTIKKGINKPYSTSSGDYYTKSSADKKKISQEELRRLFAESKRLYADEDIVYGSDISDLNTQLYYNYLRKANQKRYNELKDGLLNLITLLHNEKIMKDNQLTLSGNLIFGIEPQRFNRSFYMDCCYFKGKDISSREYISESRFYGTLKELYSLSINFLKSNLRSYQIEKNFNSNGRLEIDEDILTELIINALVHRDYYINSSIKIFIFDDRVEIISPGKLTNSLTIENIKNGRSIHRNPILDSICRYVLDYSGRGSGIKRVLDINPSVEFINDMDKEEFKCIIPRV